MGGAAGHLQHLHEDRDLTFADLKEILSLASTGQLEEVTEKFDGLNLVFSYDNSSGILKAARAAGDIKRGGMSAEALAAKFAGRGNLTKAFNDAFKILEGAVSVLSDKNRLEIFGAQANLWYSMEIIFAENPNVINYDSNSIVFHSTPVLQIEESGNITTLESGSAPGVKILSANIQQMQKAIEKSDWKISGPSVTRMSELSNDTILNKTIQKIDKAIARAGVTDGNNIGDYLRALLEEDVQDLKLSTEASEALIARCMQDDYAPSLIDIKKMIDKSAYDAVRQFVNNCPMMMKSYVRPLELAINDFAIEALKGLASTLINDPRKEVLRLRREVKNAINSMQSSGDESVIQILQMQMEKLKSVSNITSSVEGVVFIYKGNAYKFSGSFAAVNQILGLFKYGRGKIKPTEV